MSVGTTSRQVWDATATTPRLLVMAGGEPIAYPLLENVELMLGRAESAAIVIDHPSVSREHLLVRVQKGVVVVLDLGSRNGTRVRGQRLARGVPVPIASGESVEIGGVVVLLQSPSPPRPPGAGTAPPAGAMARATALADLAAPSPVSVLLLGETGVGKTFFAERIHEHSNRANALVKLNCAAVPEALLEAELFGFERGAFTGANAAKQGLFEAASGGTLLLDEIGDMPLATQAKLLHVVEQGEVVRLGSVKARRIDVRFVSATHQNLARMVANGTFRADLFYRINGIAIPIPPLRERRAEILPFAIEFLAATSGRIGRETPRLSPDATAALETHPWPGNLRELKNAMDRAAVLAQGREVTAEMLGLTSCDPGVSLNAPTSPALPTVVGDADLRTELDDFERARIVAALDAVDGHQARAAERLGIPLRTFVKRLTRYGLTRSRRRE